MEKLSLVERQNDVWTSKDENAKYAVVLMYRTSGNEVRWITKGPMKKTTADSMVEEMLNTLESGRYVCVNSQFVNPSSVVSVKITLWNGTAENGMQRYGGKSVYE